MSATTDPHPLSVTTDVLVVGAGAVGLTAAIDLARRGVCVRVFDRDQARSRTESRALGIQARALEVFERLGVIDQVLAAGRPIQGFAYHVRSRPLLHVGVHGVDAPYPFILLLPQGHLEEILIDRLSELGVAVERGVEAVAITQDEDAVNVNTRRPPPDGDPDLVTARYVVAADGGRSTLRHALGARFDGAAFEGVIHLLDTDLELHGTPPAEDRGNFFAGANTIVGLGRLHGSVWRVIAYLRPDDPRAAGELTVDGMQSVLDEHPYLGARVRSVQWQSVYRVSNRMVDQLRYGRVFLAGDAAHIHSPMGGQGLNTGVQDAHNLAWKLADRLAGAPDALLDSYQAERLPVIRSVLRETALGHRLLSRHGRALARPVPAAIARLTAPLLESVLNRPPLGTRVGRALAQVSVNYRTSPIVVERSASAGPVRAGDRAPDVPALLTTTGASTRLHRVLAADTAHHVLAFAGEHANDVEIASLGEELAAFRTTHPEMTAHRVFVRAPGYQPVGAHVDDLHDLDGQAHRRYGCADGGVCVVRPDGYLGVRSDALDDEAEPWSTTALPPSELVRRGVTGL